MLTYLQISLILVYHCTLPHIYLPNIVLVECIYYYHHTTVSIQGLVLWCKLCILKAYPQSSRDNKHHSKKQPKRDEVENKMMSRKKRLCNSKCIGTHKKWQLSFINQCWIPNNIVVFTGCPKVECAFWKCSCSKIVKHIDRN